MKFSRGYKTNELELMFQYITEKFWSRLKMNVIPIVLGQARYFIINNKSESRRYSFSNLQSNYSTIAPPHSFINALEFPEPGRIHQSK